MLQSNRKNWHARALALGAAVLLTQGLRAEPRDDNAKPTAGPTRATATNTSATVRTSDPTPTIAAPAAPAKAQSVTTGAVVPTTPAASAIFATPSSTASNAPPVGNAANTSKSTLNPLNANSGAIDNDDALDVTNAERLAIKVQGLPELSGDYRINDDQTISVPVVGRLSVTRMDPADLEKLLAERIASLTGREAYVTVEIAEYRPVFVSGYVTRPGTAPWKPGLTVLQAITVAGGDYRAGGGSNENITLKSQRAIDDQKRLLAQIARLEAERSGAKKISIPDELIARVGKKEAMELVAAQSTLFDSRRSAYDAQIAGLDRAITLTKKEFDAMSSQRDRLNDQVKFRREQYARLKILFERGLLRIDRLNDEQIKMADIEERLASLGVSVARGNSTLVGLERELSDARQKVNADIDSQLLKLERERAQLDLEIKSFGAGRARPQTVANGAEQRDTVIYEIVRRNRLATRAIRADQYTVLRPGDMVVVSMQQ